jgi:hypothetical protein
LTHASSPRADPRHCGRGASLPKAIDSDPVSLITAIYQTYLDNTELLTDIYSKRLQALIGTDAQETPEGMVERIDWDVFVDVRISP